MNVAALSRESASVVSLGSRDCFGNVAADNAPIGDADTPYRCQLCREGVQDLPLRTAETYHREKLCMLSKRSNYPIHAFNAELISLMSGHSRAGWCTHSSKTLHARRHHANQARNRVTFDSNRVGAQSRKPQAARCKIWQGDHDMCTLRYTLFLSGQEVKLQSGIVDTRYSSARTCFFTRCEFERETNK